MRLIRFLTLTQLRHNIKLSCRHIPGLQNTLADFLSRLQVEEFHEATRGRQTTQYQLPESLWPLSENAWNALS